MKNDIRVIRPGFSRFRILYVLSRHNRRVVVYNIDNPVENKAYSVIHEIMWDLHEGNLVDYGRNIAGDGNFMLAKITQSGRSYFNNRVIAVVGVVFTVLSALAAVACTNA